MAKLYRIPDGNQDDAELLKSISEGDESAFERFFVAYRDKLYNYLFRITKSNEIAEELVIDVFLKFWLRREMVAEIEDLDAYLHKMAYNKALDFFRQASRHTELQKLISRQMEITVKDADHVLLEHEYQNILSGAIEKLSPQRKLIFTMSRVDELSHEEIASKLNLSEHTVKNAIVKSLQVLRKHFQNFRIFFF
ncbi:RNA polymerase sigma-70 factor [Chitinophagaceae bacterium 26-R-25]|nr:RNA polymerase sigma-70 factor [Chitinophagaceae bacterium 26-R-25]